MQVVLLIQSGEDGPVKLVGATDRNLERVVEKLQHGNPHTLRIRLVLDGDERLEEWLGTQFLDHRLVRGWHKPDVLELIPGDVAHYAGYDDYDEERRLAAARLADPAEWE